MIGLRFSELLCQARHYLAQMWAGWQLKFPLAALAGFHTGCLERNCTAAIFAIWLSMSLLDLFVGVWLAVKRRRFRTQLFSIWAVKMATHFVTILIVGLAFRAFLAPMGLDVPLLDMFLSLLVCTVSLSILTNMTQLGLPVPEQAVRFITLAQGEAERKAAECFNQPQNGRPQRPDKDIEDDPKQQDSNLPDSSVRPGLDCPGPQQQQPGCPARPGQGRKRRRHGRVGRE